MNNCENIPDYYKVKWDVGANIKQIIYIKTTRAKNNFYKHLQNNDTKKIQAMVNRGSIIIENK